MKAYELLKSEECWAQGVFARNAQGELVPYTSDKAVRWCPLGALMVCHGDDHRAEKRVRARLTALTGNSMITIWNDAPGRTFEEVHQLLKECDA